MDNTHRKISEKFTAEPAEKPEVKKEKSSTFFG